MQLRYRSGKIFRLPGPQAVSESGVRKGGDQAVPVGRVHRSAQQPGQPLEHGNVFHRFPHRYRKGYAFSSENILQGFRLALHPVEHRHVPPWHSSFMELPDPAGKVFSLKKGIEMVPDHDARSLLPCALQVGRVLEKTPCSLQDGGTGPVVEWKGKLLCSELEGEGPENIPAASPPAVDHLVWVPHRKEFRILRRHGPEKIHLGGVAVLEFVHDDPPGRPPALPCQFRGVPDEVVEVHGVLKHFLLCQQFHKPGDAVLVLHPAEERPSPRAGLEPLRQPVPVPDGQPVLNDQPFGHFHHSVRIENGEGGRVAEGLHGKEPLEHPHGDAVKCSEPGHLIPSRSGAEEGHPVPYFVRRPVGEGQHHHVLQGYPPGSVFVEGLTDEDRGLAASHAGIDEGGAPVLEHRLSLVGIQPVQEIPGRVHWSSLPVSVRYIPFSLESFRDFPSPGHSNRTMKPEGRSA
ncbi:hypothetical protein SDC9_81532 [bioreactor metagenome]|uniref:Uncharacterized protein n=1 Tax=bioreactor metagenome TaxID=1076179 RepID=A0A644Z2F5_9ZZZZ